MGGIRFENKGSGEQPLPLYFPDAREIDRILDMEPWNFIRSLLLLKRFEGFFMGDLGSSLQLNCG